MVVIVGIKSTAPTQISTSTYSATILSQDVHHVATTHVAPVTMDTTLMFIKCYPTMQTVNLVVKPFQVVKLVKVKEVVINVLSHTSIIMVNALLNLEILSVALIHSALEDQLQLKSLWTSLFSSFLSL